MPRMQRELSRLQFQRDFSEAQARYDMMLPDDENLKQASFTPMNSHNRFTALGETPDPH